MSTMKEEEKNMNQSNKVISMNECMRIDKSIPCT